MDCKDFVELIGIYKADWDVLYKLLISKTFKLFQDRRMLYGWIKHIGMFLSYLIILLDL